MRAPALLLLAIISLTPPTLGQSPGGEPTMLHLIDYKYIPDPIEVAPGATVVVMSFPDTNKTASETEPHTVTDIRCPQTGPCETFDVQNIPPDASQHPFTAPTKLGTYPYFCRYHGDRQGSGMVGTLIVTQAPAAATPSPAGVGATPPASPDETPLAPWLFIAAFAGGAALLRRR